MKKFIQDYLKANEMAHDANLVTLIEDIITVHNSRLIASLGDNISINEYTLQPDEYGKWWLNHKHVESGIPFEQFLNTDD